MDGWMDGWMDPLQATALRLLKRGREGSFLPKGFLSSFLEKMEQTLRD